MALIYGFEFKLTLKDKKLLKPSKVRAWLRECEDLIAKKIHEDVPADALWSGLSDYAQPRRVKFRSKK